MTENEYLDMYIEKMRKILRNDLKEYESIENRVNEKTSLEKEKNKRAI
ncbi:hypothetical protein ACTPEW_12155 [Clostridioides difficile]